MEEYITNNKYIVKYQRKKEELGANLQAKLNSNKYVIKYWSWIMKFFPSTTLLVSIAFMDPGNFSTSITAASSFQYKLLFGIIVANFFAVIIQSLSCKLGVVTGLDLAQNCKKNLPKWMNVVLFLAAEISIVATDIAEVVGTSFALKILFNIPLVWGSVITVFDTLLVLLFYSRDSRNMNQIKCFEIFVSLFVIATVICFIYQLSTIHVPSQKVLWDGFVPHFKLFANKDYIYQFISIIGATVMESAIFLETSCVTFKVQNYDYLKTGQMQERPSFSAVKAILKNSVLELVIVLFFVASFINCSILIVAGSAIYNTPEAEDASIVTLYNVMCASISKGAGTVFALSILFCGFSSSFITTMCSEIITTGFLDLKIRPWLTRLITRVVAVTPVIVIAALVGENGMTAVLNLSQVILSLLLPLVSAPLIYFTSCKKYMCVLKDNSDEKGSVILGKVDEGSNSVEGNDELLNNNELKVTEVIEVNEEPLEKASGFSRVYYNNGWILLIVSGAIWFIISGLNIYMVTQSMNKESLGF
ncbi:natural resistance-associated macrophage protein [Hanseniaspora valbyensis NRRL Y-1626]|uniref:Natural resistance-associated macrophage protein n=1 Tax=Hanseniaspora valbyensis NRRL Y-1626 TaxID=766949 RepID=A0A1B7TJC5_9ASCO|nr:natural resistance-associated macrophage protein [Hanseniaspora valbyensis NRRL Y-1626]